jgi:hypothetical protein
VDAAVVLAIANVNVSRKLAAFKFEATLGDGVAVTFTVSHGRNSQAVNVSVLSSEEIPPAVESIISPDNDSVVIVFDVAPATNSVNVTVI